MNLNGDSENEVADLEISRGCNLGNKLWPWGFLSNWNPEVGPPLAWWWHDLRGIRSLKDWGEICWGYPRVKTCINYEFCYWTWPVFTSLICWKLLFSIVFCMFLEGYHMWEQMKRTYHWPPVKLPWNSLMAHGTCGSTRGLAPFVMVCLISDVLHSHPQVDRLILK